MYTDRIVEDLCTLRHASWVQLQELRAVTKVVLGGLMALTNSVVAVAGPHGDDSSRFGHRDEVMLDGGADHGTPPHALVVLVHGFSSTSDCWDTVIEAMRGRHTMVLTFDYSAFGTSIEQIAQELSTATKRFINDHKPRSVHLVGHSLGGIVVVQALSDELFARRVDQIITIGSPHHGCPLAGLVPVTQVLRDLRPGSALLRRLGSAATHGSHRWLSISSPLDLVVPTRWALGPDRAERVTIADAGHCGLLHHPEVLAHLQDAVHPELGRMQGRLRTRRAAPP